MSVLFPIEHSVFIPLLMGIYNMFNFVSFFITSNFAVGNIPCIYSHYFIFISVEYILLWNTAVS